MYKLDCQYLRPKKAAHLTAWHEEHFEKRTELSIWQGNHATLLPVRKFAGDDVPHGRGGVVNEHGAYVPLSAYEHRVQGAYAFDCAPYQDQKIVFCGYYVPHWGHFLVENIARLWYCLKQDPTIDQYVFVVRQDEVVELKGNYRAFFEHLGIFDKIRLINTPTTFREVVVPELSFYLNRYYTQQFLDLYQTVVKNAQADPAWQPYEKIFFTRTQLRQTNDCDCGAEVFDDFFTRNGYSVLAPEQLTLDQMIFYIQNADVVATMSGSVSHNILFGKQGQKMLILERCVNNNEWQVSANRMMELDVTYIDACLPIYPVATGGPFLLAYNEHVRQFAEDNHMLPPDPGLCSEKFNKRSFQRYMKTYFNMNRYHWHMEPRYIPLSGYMMEAYQEGQRYFEAYLNGSKPFLPVHYFQWHYWKQFVKWVLRKVGLR